MATEPLANGHHHVDEGIPHPDQLSSDLVDVPKSSHPPSEHEDQPHSASPEAPPTGIEDAATLKPLSCPGRPHDTIMTDASHDEGHQAATAAADARLDDPVAFSGQGVPQSNGGDTEASPSRSPTPDAVGPIRGQQQLKDGRQVAAHTGNGILPSAPPLFSGLDDGIEGEEASTPLTSEAQSPSQALKRPNSRSPMDDESSKRLRIDSVTAIPDAPVAGPSSSPSPRASSIPAPAAPLDALSSSGAAAPPLQPSDTPAPADSAADPAPVAPVYESEPTPPPEPAREWFIPGSHNTHLSLRQQKYLRNVISNLRKHRCAGPFSQPVDPIALGIPHYPKVIKRPMDLSKVDIRLGKPGKPSYYNSLQEFVADIQLIFENCYKFNGPPSTAGISKMATELASHFEIQMKRVPADEPPPPPPAPPAPPAPPVVAPQPKKAAKAASPPRPVARSPEAKDAYVAKWNAGVEAARDRPKREIKVPDKELPYFAEQAEKEAARPKPQKRRESAVVAPKMVLNAKEELKFAREVVKEMNSKKHYKIAWPFYTPVDYVAMGIPDYPRIITKPMDLGTVKSKLEAGDYKNGAAFAGDMRLIFNNCYTYNGLDSQVGQLGKQLEQVFEMKWLDRPPEKVPAAQTKAEPDSDDERQRQLKAQIEALQAQYAQAEAAKKQKKPKAPKQVAHPARPKSNGVPRPSHPKSAPPVATKAKKSAPRYRDDEEDEYEDAYRDEDGGQFGDDDDYEVITYEQKKGLAQSIGDADEDMMTRAIELIRAKRPDLMGPSNEEIELDIDAMDDRTLYKLYVLICGPPRNKQRSLKSASSKKTGKAGGATGGRSGGTKAGRRQTLDLAAEAAQIEQLRAKLDQYEGARGGAAGAVSAHQPAPPKAPEYASSSSDSESSDDDSD